MLLRYSSLESPFHGVRLSGKQAMSNGSAVVELPEYVRDLVHNVDDNNMSIQLTGFKTDENFYVSNVDIANNRFTISCGCSEAHEVFWSFTATRKDVEPLVVEF